MLTLLGFGSSARRGATGWTGRARVRALLDVAQPDVVVDGASPSDRREVVDGAEVLRGADLIVHVEALAHFDRRGLPTARAIRCPFDHAIDGPAPRGFLARNARQYREHRPILGAGLISGKVGTPFSSGSAHMLGICLRGLRGSGDDPRVRRAPPCPVVVYREDGIEPYDDLGMAIEQLRRLYAVTQDKRLVAPGKALASLCERGDPPPGEVAIALDCAAEGSRWAPWIEAVAATVRRT